MSDKIYCSICRAKFSEMVERNKYSSEIYRKVEVLQRINLNQYQCKCFNCGHIWKSKSKDAENLFNQYQIIDK